MKKYFFAMYAIIGLLFVTSCSNENEIDVLDGTLTLSKDVIEFEKEAAEESINVTTDVDRYTAVGIAEWIDVEIIGSKLTIKVKANETVYARTGKVLVMAGTSNATIKVKQKGMKGSAEIVPDQINLEDTKGQFVVEVNANDDKWSAMSDSEWLRVEAKTHKAELVLDYDENIETNDRTALITITVGNDKTEVEVKQFGRMFFILPYRDLKNAIPENIIAFEKERRNFHDEEHSDEMALSFKTRSKVFPTLDYIFTEDGNISKVILFPKDADTMSKHLNDYYQYLSDNGFEKSGSVYVDKKNSVTAQVLFYKSYFGLMSHVEFKLIPVQDKSYPTFKEFPYGYEGWGDMKDKIDAYEAANGGTYNDLESIEDDDTSFYYYDNEDEDIEARAYFVKNGSGLNETVQYYLDYSLAFFEHNGEMYVTKEFMALCEKEGFVYKGFDDFHIFYNKEKSLGCAIRYVKFEGMDYSVLDLHMVKKESKSSQTNQKYIYFENVKKAESEIPFLNESARNAFSFDNLK